MSNSQDKDKDKGKSRGKSALDGASHTFRLTAGVSQDLQDPETGDKTPKQLSSRTPQASTGQRGRNHRESVGTKTARDRAIKAFDGIDDLLPMLEAEQARDLKEKDHAGSGGSTTRSPGQQTMSPFNPRASPSCPTKANNASPVKQPSRSVNATAGPSNMRRAADEPGSRRPGLLSTRPFQGAHDKTRRPRPDMMGNDLGGEKKKGEKKDGNTREPGDPSASGPPGPSHAAVASSSKVPFDLPTEHYAAIITQPDFPYYLDYPARIHHLKYPTTAAHSNSNWEEIHLHQKVSLPRTHARWVREITETDRTRMKTSFVRFAAATPSHGRSSNASASASASGEPIMGFRTYRDTLFLDAAYISAFRAHQTRFFAQHARFDTTQHIASFLPSETDRAKIKTLAVAASAFTNGEKTATTTTTAAAAAATDSLCQVLAAAFPSLQRILLVSLAVIDRPTSAGWDLETAFARWLRLSDAVRLEARQVPGLQQTRNGPVATFGRKMGLVCDERAAGIGDGKGDTPILVAAVEAAWARARARARVETTSRAHQYGDGSAELDLGLESDSESGSLSSTGAVVEGGDADESMGQDPRRELIAEAFIMLYYRDAYDRAVAKGWKHDALLPLDNLDLGLE